MGSRNFNILKWGLITLFLNSLMFALMFDLTLHILSRGGC